MTTQALLARGVPANLPPVLLYLKIAILALSLIILAVSAYAISLFNSWVGYYGGNGVGGLNVFVVIKTFIIYGIAIAFQFRFPHLFYRIAAIALYAISVVFWLSAWAWSADLAAFWLTWSDGYVDDGVFYDPTVRNEGAALAVCAALGAVVWVLSIVHLALFVRACLAEPTIGHQQAELGQVPVVQKQEATTTVYAAPAPVQYQVQPVYQQPQQVYTTQ